MTLGGRLVSLFPVLHGLAILTSLVVFVMSQNLIFLASFFAAIYVLPLLFFRLHNLFLPLTEGFFDIAAKKYSVWWASYQFQFVFIAMPVFEAPLHLIPGAYSMWLRLWGSKIGKNVLWTPRVEVVDRGLLEIGSHVVVGHLVAFCSHAITPRKGKMTLMVKKITIGEGSFVGADSQFGPGANVSAGEMVKVKSAIYWKGSYE
jgi:hypothetical protein